MGEITQLAADEEKLARTGQAGAGPSVATATDRRLDAENWLLSAALDRARARTDWAEQGVALLRCDGPFNAVKICADLVHAAAGTDVPSKVDAYLAQALHGGPVFYDLIGCEYYVLCRRPPAVGSGPSTGRVRPSSSAGTAAWACPGSRPSSRRGSASTGVCRCTVRESWPRWTR